MTNETATAGPVEAQSALSITKPQLRAALFEWEQEHREGKTRPTAQSLGMPIDDVVDESTDHLWGKLNPPQEVEEPAV